MEELLQGLKENASHSRLLAISAAGRGMFLSCLVRSGQKIDILYVYVHV